MPSRADNERAMLILALGLTDAQAAKLSNADLNSLYSSGGTGDTPSGIIVDGGSA